MNIEKEAASCYNALMKVLTYADLRKHLADDEHRDPLPIYGSRPFISERGWPYRNKVEYRDPLYKLRTLREDMSTANPILYSGQMEGIDNEEGC